MQELITKIEQWAKDRNLDEQGTVEAQAIKTAEEMAELIIGISKDNVDMIKDAVGDVVVTLIVGNMISPYPCYVDDYIKDKKIDQADTKKMLIDSACKIIIANLVGGYDFGIIDATVCFLNRVASNYNLTLRECVQSAYNEIKDRKGKMINGQFVKESEL